MRNLIAKELKIKFIEVLTELDGFSYENGNPFPIKISSKKYFIFLKNLSPAYFKNSPDVTRIQLPYSDHFSKIFKEDTPFIVFGYDVDTDTVVAWNPKKIKERLNAKNNVSLYSRYSLQEQVKEGEFKLGYLSNGEKIILFKRKNLAIFFDVLKDLFKEYKSTKETIQAGVIDKPLVGIIDNKLYDLTDKILLKQLTPLLKKNQVLRAVEITSRYYEGKYMDMTFKDWYKLVNDIYKKMNS